MSNWNAFKDWQPDPATVIADTSKPGTRQRAAKARTEPGPLPAYPRGGIVAPERSQAARTGDEAPASDCTSIYLAVTPCPKPRMTQRDKWMRRPAVIRYRAFCDAVRACWPAGVPYPEAGAHVTFHLPMPRSWSKAKREAMKGTPHRQKPDRDNLEKALLDALHSDDCAVWDGRTTKRWSEAGYITISQNRQDLP